MFAAVIAYKLMFMCCYRLYRIPSNNNYDRNNYNGTTNGSSSNNTPYNKLTDVIANSIGYTKTNTYNVKHTHTYIYVIYIDTRRCLFSSKVFSPLKGSGHGREILNCLKIQKVPLIKPIMSPSLHPATSRSSSWNLLPSHFSLRLNNLSNSSSSLHNLQKYCVLPTPLPLKAPID
ncbi:hypothetical protein FF38_06730 [Lucilia cuprina]|uniref:Uncharacterized protein n=1 Tax=Lucilia cuprina TaxID=7375 RepID=A0A0L0CK94_LUCCU|nr:hypothetical protein FF38_06730 [Lucilia cuprina]